MIAGLPSSRALAKHAGVRHYYTGTPCKHGHESTRRTSNGACCQCDPNYGAPRSKADPNNRRKDAAAKGHKYYDTGLPCKYGHTSNRSTASSRCLMCVAEINAKFKETFPEKYEASARKDREKRKDVLASWRIDHREESRELRKLHYSLNKAYYLANATRRKASKLQRTPTWLTDDDKEQMRLVYAISKRVSEETGTAYHVDHLVPLQGELVSGLHVPWNLQLLTASDNIAKSNSFII